MENKQTKQNKKDTKLDGKERAWIWEESGVGGQTDQNTLYGILK